MYECLIAVCLVLLLALGVIFFLAIQLAGANKQAMGFAAKCLEHTCAFNEDQRLFMQTIRSIEADKPVVEEPVENYRPRVHPQPETISVPIQPFGG